MLSRNMGTRLSTLLQLDDPAQAFNLDRIVNLRLLIFDSEREKSRAEALDFDLSPSSGRIPQHN